MNWIPKVYRAPCGCWFFEWGSIWWEIHHNPACRCQACGQVNCVCAGE